MFVAQQAIYYSKSDKTKQKVLSVRRIFRVFHEKNYQLRHFVVLTGWWSLHFSSYTQLRNMTFFTAETFQFSTFPLISAISKAFSGKKYFWKWSPMHQPQKVNFSCCLEHFCGFPCLVLVLLYFGLPRFSVLNTLSCSVYQNPFMVLNCVIRAICFQPLDNQYGRITNVLQLHILNCWR